MHLEDLDRAAAFVFGGVIFNGGTGPSNHVFLPRS